MLLIYLQITSSLNGNWPEWIMAKGVYLANLSNMQSSGLGLSCLFPQLADPVITLATTMMIIPVLTLALVATVLILSCSKYFTLCWEKLFPPPEDDFSEVC